MNLSGHNRKPANEVPEKLMVLGKRKVQGENETVELFCPPRLLLAQTIGEKRHHGLWLIRVAVETWMDANEMKRDIRDIAPDHVVTVPQFPLPFDPEDFRISQFTKGLIPPADQRYTFTVTEKKLGTPIDHILAERILNLIHRIYRETL